MDAIRNIWKQSNIQTPSVLSGIYRNEYYVTVSDHKSIVRFASKKLDIYVAVKSKCNIVMDKGEPVYFIDELDALQVISCTKPITDIDRFVTSEIVPVYFSLPKNSAR